MQIYADWCKHIKHLQKKLITNKEKRARTGVPKFLPDQLS